MREKIGTTPIIMVGATLLAINSDRQLLMIKLTYNNGLWGVPGGAMEPGESLEDTLRRECQEEIGACPVAFSLFGVYSGPGLFYQYPNGDEVHNVLVVYLVQDFF